MQEHEMIPAREFCRHYHVEINFIYTLQEYGLVDVISNEGTDFLISEQLKELEKMLRLHNELNVNMEGIDVIIHLLKQLEVSQHEVNQLRNELKFYR